MARSVKQARRPAATPCGKPVRKRRWSLGAAAVGTIIARNPAAAGGSTALFVAIFYVSANALWYQPHIHRNAFFPTRDFVRVPDPALVDSEPETTFMIERPAGPIPAVPADPVTRQVQGILKDLGFYNGKVDGLSGPATGGAINNYRRKVGLTASASIDQDLLVQLGIEPTTAGIAPSAAPRGVDDAVENDPVARTKKIQAGLKAFGNQHIEIDGLMGARTGNAIKEFQTIFGLPVTGEPDKALHAKMREEGLTN